MTLNSVGRRLTIGFIVALCAGCSGASSAGSGATGGVGGTGGAGGARCPDEAIDSCLDLLDCCRAILINPVFFQSCNSVVLQCDQDRCLEVLGGYPQCAPDPELDAGAPDAG